MNNIKPISCGEIFFLYWHGCLQPCGRRENDIYQYIFLQPEQIPFFTLKSNYRENVPLAEICDFI